MKFFFLAFLVVPIVEIYFLITVGSVIGAGLTIFLIILTAVIGAALVRHQGLATYARAQTQLQNREMPAMEVLEGMFLLFAGALLMTPGFVTDAIGFACLTPPLRQMVIRRMIAAGAVRAAGSVHAGPDVSSQDGRIPPRHGPGQQDSTRSGGTRSGGTRSGETRTSGRVIEGEYEDLDR